MTLELFVAVKYQFFVRIMHENIGITSADTGRGT